ncbi:hypothetical protein O181_051473 [Austropuccinia psidii MF-1]|uniref:Folylpolyglutamate synthase n=1 Tax=Austropuccinia psidii MF-1 TaxID=1389203 RepID=A0A9Q3E103_9BASI|nr:hypothetical protein [Austropuccinia psidii MF-1]
MNLSRQAFRPSHLQLTRQYYKRCDHKKMSCEYKNRDYEEAVIALNRLQSNANVLASIQAAGPLPSKEVFASTNYYLRRAGYRPQDLNELNAIHISGTKGKGSTSAFCYSLLNDINPSSKIGLFTSPHLVAVRERIQINGKPLSEGKFAEYFWQVWDRFDDGQGEPLQPELPIRPAYFRYLVYLAYHVFLAERVDASIFEVGIGGLLDATNLIPSPIVTGVTSLGFDHVQLLGHSILEIAGHKGGIFKPGVPALTVAQYYPETLEVLKARALEVKASSFTTVPKNTALDDIQLGLAGEHQKLNASLAIALVNTFLGSPRIRKTCKEMDLTLIKDETATNKPMAELKLPSDPSPISSSSASSSLSLPQLPAELVSPNPLSTEILRGLQNVEFSGRCQKILDRKIKNLYWYIDGAHTIESMKFCGNWFKTEINQLSTQGIGDNNNQNYRKINKVLIFNCTNGRSPQDLLKSLLDALGSVSEKETLSIESFDCAIFTPNITYMNQTYKPDLKSVASDTKEKSDISENLKNWNKVWNQLPNLHLRDTKIKVTSSIEESINQIKNSIATEPNSIYCVLVTGSLHLIGGVIEILESN